ncbi:hypothetical protein BTA51_28125 [Hahella sp. CCB-MM4]|uniref:hypothetical protein n=1 Tax=Hahella sp. (strain CCB-MM4) TaxID=1926491 RepID=UPI000B9A6304|nr:hypothetical protein [Hahella sp. CCB-MM4]OZG69998.1 hypothetical protein BTA51_28125 [Hahella sp. CCB-MM4]
MRFIEKNLVTIYGNQGFLDWLISVEPSLRRWTLEHLNNDPGAYLIEIEDQNCQGEAIKKYYGHIFEEELGNHLPSGKWPINRTYELFCEWFSIKYHTCVADMTESEDNNA